MAFGFIKKVFSFGRKDEPKPVEAEAPTAVEATDAAALPEAVEAPPTPAEPETRPSAETPAPAPIEPEPIAVEPAPAPRPEPELVVEPVIEPVVERATIVESVAELEAAIEVPPPPEPGPVESVAAPDITEPEPEAPAPAEPEGPVVATEPVAEPPAPGSDAKSEAEDRSPPPSTEIPAKEPAPPPADAAAEPETPAPVEPKGRITVAKTVEAKAETAAETGPAPRAGWFQRLRAGLARSSSSLTSSISGVFTKKKLDEDTLQDLEDVLISADLGVQTALAVTDTLASTRLGRDVTDAEVRAVMAAEIEKALAPVALPLELDLSHKPHVILVVGVNGTGKTTTIGKLAAKLVAGGLKVTLAAGDTFRAAAIEQLHIWGSRTGSTVVSSRLGADAAGLAYDAFEQAKAEGADVLIIDTAGRLQNKAELMDELAKIVRVLGKLDPEAPHTVLQTLDATTGQNAMNQVEIFRNVAGVNGLVMTKLDGTARGGILVAIAAKHRLPVYFIGVGEAVDDLEPFAAKDFAAAIAGVQA